MSDVWLCAEEKDLPGWWSVGAIGRSSLTVWIQHKIRTKTDHPLQIRTNAGGN